MGVLVFVLANVSEGAEPKSYAPQVIAGDAIAVSLTALTIGVGAVPYQRNLYRSPMTVSEIYLQPPAVALSMLPTMMTAPLLHVVRGRWKEGLVSFVGWSTIGVTSWMLNHELLTTKPTCDDGPPCRLQNERSAVAPIVFAGSTAIGMTVLDAWMAKPASLPDSERASYAFEVATADVMAIASIAIAYGTAYNASSHTLPLGTHATLFIPVLTMAPVVHLTHRRWIAAASSFFGWATAAMTTFGCIGLFGEALRAPSAAIPIAFLNGSVSAIALTGMDIALAARSHAEKAVEVAPTGWIDNHGAGAGLQGAF